MERARKALREAWEPAGRHRGPRRPLRTRETPRKPAPGYGWADYLVWLVALVSFATLLGVVHVS